MTNAIEVRALRKSFGRTRALDGLDLTVRTGEVHAFLGPNDLRRARTSIAFVMSAVYTIFTDL